MRKNLNKPSKTLAWKKLQLDIGKEYLEKLIQYPIRIPQLNADEVEVYISCLLLQPELKKEDFDKVLSWVIQQKKEDYEKFRISSVTTLFSGNEELHTSITESLSVANQLASVLTNGLHGNPRQCKRFLNSMDMRLQMASYKNKILDRKNFCHNSCDENWTAKESSRCPEFHLCFQSDTLSSFSLHCVSFFILSVNPCQNISFIGYNR